MTWRELYEYDGRTGITNRERLNEQKRRKKRPSFSIDNPNLIYPGDVILVPSEERRFTVRRHVRTSRTGRIRVRRRTRRVQIARVVARRGKRESRESERPPSFLAWDNIFVLPRFDSAESYRSNLARKVSEFVRDHSPSARKSGVDVWIIQENRMYVYDRSGANLGSLPLRCMIRGLVGAYALYHFPGLNSPIVLDVNSHHIKVQRLKDYSHGVVTLEFEK